MNKTNTWLIRVFAVVLICICLIAYVNAKKKPSLLHSKPSIEDLEYKAFLLRPKPSIEDLEYKALDKDLMNLFSKNNVQVIAGSKGLCK